ncbi:MAG: ATP-dependent sacrificial sulfur transferase LarE [Clostridia bacterium]|nr:ATP-dependent sacrificial sulfur transferase LarE [Clostridia bacterium]
MDELHLKKEKLQEILRSLSPVAIAFSSGVDSTFLLKVAHDTLGDGACAITVRSAVCPERETAEAEEFCKKEKISQRVLALDPLTIDGFRQNPPERCYLCKKSLFTEMVNVAREMGCAYLAEGSNADDDGDYRPGMKAIRELGVRSPLRDAGLTKSEIRLLSRELELPTWDKPSLACLATRFPYGEEITKEKLFRVDAAEQMIRSLGFRQVRVRVHGDVARIEISPSDFSSFLKEENASEVDRYLKELGFLYIALDIGGYKTGSMNRSLGL